MHERGALRQSTADADQHVIREAEEWDDSHDDGGVPGENFPDDPNPLEVYIEQVSTVMGIVAGDMLPTLRVSQKCGFDVMACAMPKRNESVDLRADLIMSQFFIAGFGGITDAEGKQVFVPFCNCCQESVRAFNALASQHFLTHMPGVCQHFLTHMPEFVDTYARGASMPRQSCRLLLMQEGQTRS